MSDMDHGGYEQWVEAITETTFAIASWGGSVPRLYHIKHLEPSGCDHVEWVLVKWSAGLDTDSGEDCDFDNDPNDFMNTMLAHKFNIKSPEYIFSFVSQRMDHEPLATPINLCIGNHDEERQCDHDDGGSGSLEAL